ncbi:TetR/AcrR family transcriptional regulator [Gryllotalpicola reticulitermitis]|uniref:TetR/AcrR family transcriptional regulator n=1 Tax=Gryllotalpicola reticulitermitis TaxID=1184153 RepID=A0ABV8Q6Z1_9MICO
MPRPRSFDETETLRAVRDRFWSTGYAGTSVDDISTATGLGKGSLYGAFGDKHQLFVRVFGDYCTETIDGVRAALDGPEETAFDRLRAHVRDIAAGTAADVDRRGCLLAKGTAELAETDATIAARAAEAFDDYEALVLRCIEQAQAHGDIDPAADADQLALLLLAVLRGIEALGKAGRSPQALDQIAEGALAVLPRGARSIA